MLFSLLHKGANGFRPYMGLKNITIDICRVSTDRSHSVIIDWVLDDLKMYSNILEPCPKSVDINIYLNPNQSKLKKE